MSDSSAWMTVKAWMLTHAFTCHLMKIRPGTLMLGPEHRLWKGVEGVIGLLSAGPQACICSLSHAPNGPPPSFPTLYNLLSSAHLRSALEAEVEISPSYGR
ncbi:unnamed protein product [Cercospora beticola]|nr:unnamed protein product [Cercospora beticola]